MAERFEKGALLIEGKTKRIWYRLGESYEYDRIVESKEDITAFEDPDFTKQFKDKPRCANVTTSRVFQFLKDAGIPVAFKQQISDTEFLTEHCEMIALEVLARRYAGKGSSYLKRRPDLVPAEGGLPHRFHKLLVEFTLKTTKGGLTNKQGKALVHGLDNKKGEEDPLIVDPRSSVWKLVHSKKPAWSEESDLKRSVLASDVIDNLGLIDEIELLMRKIVLLLEGAFNTLGYRFMDIKLEFGFTKSGRLVVTDVIDSDSWRLCTWDWQDISKESHRQGEDIKIVEAKYQVATKLVEQFRIPRQALVLWRASDKDTWPHIIGVRTIPGIDVVEVDKLSGHKAPRKSANKLGEVLTMYPDGGVIVFKVGMSNGLGPTVAARTSWPAISVPKDAKEFPDDVWSNLRLPSLVPMATILADGNALLLALNILAAKNPVAYMIRQLAIEELDD